MDPLPGLPALPLLPSPVIIYVDTAVTRRNIQTGERKPVFIVDFGHSRNPVHCSHVEILGPSRLVYNPDRQKESGATAWIETVAEVVCSGIDEDADRYNG